MKLTFVSHACVLLEICGKTIVTDPFIQDVGAAKRKCPQLFAPDAILLTHGHDDHTYSLSDVYDPKKTTIYAIVELASYLSKRGYKNVYGMNFGGSVRIGDARVSLVPARHTSASQGAYLGEAAGFVVEGEGQSVYHAGDTDLFSDMALIRRLYAPTVGLLPIGGRFTMDAERAAICANEYFAFDVVVPIHYNTFPGIEASPETFAASVKTGKVAALSSFGSLVL